MQQQIIVTIVKNKNYCIESHYVHTLTIEADFIPDAASI